MLDDDLVKLLPGLIVLDSFNHSKHKGLETILNEFLKFRFSHVGVNSSQFADRVREEPEGLSLNDSVVIKFESQLYCDRKYLQEADSFFILFVISSFIFFDSSTFLS